MPSATDLLAERHGSPADPTDRPLRRPPLALWLALYALCVGAVTWAVHTTALFADDFLFLSQAREHRFDRKYLELGLFRHYSPVSRAVNRGLVAVLPHWRAAPFAGLIVMDLLVVAGVILLMTAVFGRTWLAWVGSLLLGSSLSLVPLAHWWTAGVNILPAMAGVTAGFGGMVRYLRGRSAWWVALAAVGYLVAITDYELGMLLPLYLALWVLGFGRRALGQSLRAVLRRTWWAWALLTVMLVWAVQNYYFYYYKPVPKAGLRLIVDGLAVSLFHALLPALVGIHGDRYAPAWDSFGVVVGVVLLVVLFGWTMLRSRRAWRGWAFAFIGWLLPALALVVNRLGLTHTTAVATNVIYQFMAIAMFLVGVFEAIREGGPLTRLTPLARLGTAATTAGRRRWQLVIAGGTALCVLAGFGWAHSVDPVLRPQFISSSARHYVGNIETGAAAAARGGPYGLLSTTAPQSLIASAFLPYNSTARIVGLYDPELRFNTIASRMFAIDPHGHVFQVRLQPLLRAEPAGTAASITAVNVSGQRIDPSRGLCFTAGQDSRVTISLPGPVTGHRLVAHTDYSVSARTTATLFVLRPDLHAWTGASSDLRIWNPGAPQLLDPITSPTVRALQYRHFAPGVSVCIRSVELSDAVRTGG